MMMTTSHQGGKIGRQRCRRMAVSCNTEMIVLDRQRLVLYVPKQTSQTSCNPAQDTQGKVLHSMSLDCIRQVVPLVSSLPRVFSTSPVEEVQVFEIELFSDVRDTAGDDHVVYSQIAIVQESSSFQCV